jgi:hypothetical protein
MNRVLETAGPTLVGQRVLAWLRAALRELRIPFAPLAEDAMRLDAVAGSEYVDDQIRHPE